MHLIDSLVQVIFYGLAFAQQKLHNITTLLSSIRVLFVKLMLTVSFAMSITL